MNTHFIAVSKSEKMPNSVKAPYRRVAVVEVAAGVTDVKMITERCRAVVSIAAQWRRVHVGRTHRGAFQRAMVEAQLLADELNA